MQPLEPSERIVSLDLARCVALFGVLVMNTTWFFNAWWFTGPEEQQFPGAANHAANFVMEMFFSGKANSLLSFLFGVGFCLQIERLKREANGTRIYARRLLVLFAFGAVHGILLWQGDVLHMYAMLGLTLPLLVRLSQRGLVLVMATLIAVGLVWRSAQWPPFDEATMGRMESVSAEMFAAVNAAHASSDVGAMIHTRLRDFAISYTNTAWFFVLSFGLTMMLGVLAFRSGWLTRTPNPKKEWPWLALTLGVGFVAAATAATIGPTLSPFDRTWRALLVGVTYSLQRPLIMVGYLILITWAAAQIDPTKGVARALVRTGRMPLTTYLTQTVIMTTLSYGYGFGWWGHVGPARALALAAALFPLQIVFSNWWLSRHRFGPLEWLWRRLSYS